MGYKQQISAIGGLGASALTLLYFGSNALYKGKLPKFGRSKLNFYS